MLPVEDVVTVPERYRRAAHPRRGGGVVAEVVLPEDAVERYRAWLRSAWQPEWFERVPTAKEVYGLAPVEFVPEVFAHGQAFARDWWGDPAESSLSAEGAAVVALTTLQSLGKAEFHELTVAAWLAAGGFGFAARAVAQLAGLIFQPGAAGRSLITVFTDPQAWEQIEREHAEKYHRISVRDCTVDHHNDERLLQELAGVLRRHAAVAGDDEYAQVVAVLGELRRTMPQRLVSSYLAPTETAWVDQDCAEVGAWAERRRAERGGVFENKADTYDERVSSLPILLAFAASTVGHLEPLVPLLRKSRSYGPDALIGTVLDGVGPAAVGELFRNPGFGPYLGLRDHSWRYIGPAGRELLGQIATDDAFRLLADATLRDQGYLTFLEVESMVSAPVFLTCPVRTLRLLAERAESGDAVAHDVLAIRVFQDQAVTQEALPLLPEPARTRVAMLLRGEETGVGAGLSRYLRSGSSFPNSAEHKRTVQRLCQIPLVDALRAVLDLIDKKYVRQALLAEGRRSPERLMRGLALLAEAGHPVAVELLQAQVLTYPEAIPAVLAALEPEARARVEAIAAAARPRNDQAPPSSVPAILHEPAGKRAKPPVLPEWLTLPLLPPVWLRGGEHTLPAAAVRRLCVMFAKAKPAEPPVEAAQVLEAAEPASLAAFAWALVEQWKAADCPAGGLALSAVAAFGDDTVVARLADDLPHWSWSASARFKSGLDALAAIGSDTALTHLSRLASEAETKASQRQAEVRMSRIAAARGLTEAELADRIAPDFDLDRDGRTVIGYGPRQFTVGFDEQFRPVVVGPDGRRLKTLPRPGAADDEALAGPAYDRFKQLKKYVPIAAGERLAALEQAMVEQRTWRVAEFRTLLVEHPLLALLARRLVWEAVEDQVTFRVAEDRTFADADDDTLALADTATVRIPHPLIMGAARPGWAEVFADYEIIQPFAQLSREVFEPAAFPFGKVVGTQVASARFYALRERGWRIGSDSDLLRELPGDLTAVIRYSPHFGYEDNKPRLVEGVELRRAADNQVVDLAELAPIMASEVLRDVHSLTS